MGCRGEVISPSRDRETLSLLATAGTNGYADGKAGPNKGHVAERNAKHDAQCNT